MKFDLNQTGLRRIFSAWQVEAMEILWEHQVPMKSGEMHSYLERKGVQTNSGKHGTVSRASVINFMNELVHDGILTYVEKTGKGGYHKVYSLAETVKTKEDFRRHINYKTLNALTKFLVDE